MIFLLDTDFPKIPVSLPLYSPVPLLRKNNKPIKSFAFVALIV